MGIIKLKNIRTYSYHGCLQEEAKIGSEYRIDLKIKANLEKPAKTDNLKDTIDYVTLNQIVVDEMAIRSNLLEHVAKRIIDRIIEEIKAVDKVEIEVSKINPPIGGDVRRVSVVIKTKIK
jgi:7,8-dihydroneopterin aldolase/epimerase/oxygenase